jgi:NADH-quinone oxidoreductase subunit J
MSPAILYTVCVLGALGLYLVVRRPRAATGGTRLAAVAGILLGLGAFGWLVIGAAESIDPAQAGARPGVFYILFSLIAIASAVRMITHTKPVYAALYFVLVVLASAGLFLLLEAEFMAFALIIVYAGAILITYLFVLMLAQQAPDPNNPAGQAEYDLFPREPAAGAVVGFILLALLSRMIFQGTGQLEGPDAYTAQVEAWNELTRMPERLTELLAEAGEEGATPGWGEGRAMLIVADDGSATLQYRTAAGEAKTLALAEEAMPENVQSVGLGLILKFPVSLELAGVILLMAMFGAVILAWRQIELTEDEKRQAAGLRRLGHHDEPAEPRGGEG